MSFSHAIDVQMTSHIDIACGDTYEKSCRAVGAHPVRECFLKRSGNDRIRRLRIQCSRASGCQLEQAQIRAARTDQLKTDGHAIG